MLFQRAVAALPEGEKKLPGDVTWRLYDTYGFPADLTQLMAEEKGLSVDLEQFEQRRKEAIGKSAAGDGKFRDNLDLDVHAIADLHARGVPTTDDSPKYDYKTEALKEREEICDTEYTFNTCIGRILAIRRAGAFVEELKNGEEGSLVVDRTNFFAEQVDQSYDVGVVSKINADGVEFVVTNTQVRDGYVILVGSLGGELRVSDEVLQKVDGDRRLAIMKNHTGAHILKDALRKVLGDVEQKGTLALPEKLCFDFIAKEVLTTAQTRPDPVREVSDGVSVLANPKSDEGLNTSVEFCGGTHLTNAAHIFQFVITNEEAIAEGIRRIVALTGQRAGRACFWAWQYECIVKRLAHEVNDKLLMYEKEKRLDVRRRVHEMMDEVNKLQMPKWRKEGIREQAETILKVLDDTDKEARKSEKGIADRVKALGPDKKLINFVVHVFTPGANSKALGDGLKLVKNVQAVMGFSVNEENGKVVVVARVHKGDQEKADNLFQAYPLVGRLKASEWVEKVCTVLGGHGGGTEAAAEGAIESVSRLKEAVELAEQFANASFA